MKITHASQLSNHELEATLKRLAGGEREATVALIVHLAEFDSRRLYAPAGFSSLFSYCVEALSLSEDAVYNRIESARAARRYPVILEMLATGALSPTTARLLARKLTPENHGELLAAAASMTKQQVEQLLACRSPSQMCRPRCAWCRRERFSDRRWRYRWRQGLRTALRPIPLTVRPPAREHLWTSSYHCPPHRGRPCDRWRPNGTRSASRGARRRSST